MKVALILLLSFSLFSCASDKAENDTNSRINTGELNNNDDSLLKKIQSLASEKACKVSSECQIIGLGARPCGGPDEYIVYSNLIVDDGQIQPLVAKYNQIKSHNNQKQGTLGICVVAEKPRIDCKQSQCVLIKENTTF